MSRFQGPAGQGASRTLRAVRRAEAETRQAAERARDAERWEQLHAAEHIKGTRTPRVELEELVDVLNGLSSAEVAWLFDGWIQ